MNRSTMRFDAWSTVTDATLINWKLVVRFWFFFPTPQTKYKSLGKIICNNRTFIYWLLSCFLNEVFSLMKGICVTCVTQQLFSIALTDLIGLDAAKYCSNLDEVCLLPEDSGPCRAAFRRYYFDKKIGHCKEFIYGGCQGNRNNFMSLRDCQMKCPSKYLVLTLLRRQWKKFEDNWRGVPFHELLKKWSS